MTICFRVWWPEPAIEVQVGWEGTGGEMSCPVPDVLACLTDDSLERFAELVRDEMERRQEG